MKLSKTKIKTNLVIINIQHFQQKVNSFREKNKKTNNDKQQIAEKRIELSTFRVKMWVFFTHLIKTNPIVQIAFAEGYIGISCRNYL